MNMHDATQSVAAMLRVLGRFRADRASLTVIVSWGRGAKGQRREENGTGSIPEAFCETVPDALRRPDAVRLGGEGGHHGTRQGRLVW